MNNQLVLQFHGESREAFARLENFEDALHAVLGTGEAFDGLDAGLHGVNVFVYTDDPMRTLERVRALLGGADSLPGFRAARRTIAEERFCLLWPPGDASAFSLR